MKIKKDEFYIKKPIKSNYDIILDNFVNEILNKLRNINNPVENLFVDLIFEYNTPLKLLISNKRFKTDLLLKLGGNIYFNIYIKAIEYHKNCLKIVIKFV